MKLYPVALIGALLIPIYGCEPKSSLGAATTAAETNATTQEERLAQLLGKADAGDKQAALDAYLHYINLPSYHDYHDQSEKWLKVLSGYQDWLTDKADHGNSQAQFALGAILFKDSKQTSKSINWLTKAAEQGYAQAQYHLGFIYLYGAHNVKINPAKAAEWLQKSAASGVSHAQYHLGQLYLTGKGVTKNPNKAAEWYFKAADQGLASAQSALGSMYNNGDGVPQDYSKAFGWFQKAAAQGDAFGQTLVGSSYLLGEGVPRNQVHAYAWFNLAAGKDSNGLYREFRDDIGARLTPIQLAEAQRLV